MAIDVGGIEEVAAKIDRFGNDPKGLFVIGGAVAIAKLIATDRPSAEPDFGDLKVGRSQLAEFQCSGAAAAAAGFAGGGALCAPIPTERCFSATSGQGPMGLPAALTGTSGIPLESFSQVILKSSRDMNISSNSLVWCTDLGFVGQASSHRRHQLHLPKSIV